MRVRELSLELAAEGYTVVGMNYTDRHRGGHQGGAGRGLSKATFVRDDITSFTGFDA